MARTTTRLFCAGAMHLARTRHAHSMRTPWTRCAHAMHTPCTRHAHATPCAGTAARSARSSAQWTGGTCCSSRPPSSRSSETSSMESTSTSARATVRSRCEHAWPCTHAMHMPRTCRANAMHTPCTRHARATQAALATLRRAPCPAVSIVGNHELYNFDRAQLARASGEGEWLKHGDKEYHSFAPAAGWHSTFTVGSCGAPKSQPTSAWLLAVCCSAVNARVRRRLQPEPHCGC